MIAPEAMVASSQPLAVQVGIDILKKGGTAVDAAIAVDAMLGLVEPMSCSLGGDLFATVWDEGAKDLVGLNGSGHSPYALTRKVFAQKGLERIPIRGVLSWSVPGCVDGWFTLHERFGCIPMHDLLAPTIHYAEHGFPVSPVIARMWGSAADLLQRDRSASATFLPHGKPPKKGGLFSNPVLAETLRFIAEGGRDTFYQGSIAEKIVSASDELNGYLTLADLADHRSTWVEPVSVPYRLEMLRIIEGFDLAEMGHNSDAYIHHVVEAKKLAYADRAHFYADPDYYDVPLEGLISPEYAARQRARIAPERAALEVPAGDPRLRDGDTVYLTVVDRERNAVSFIQSLYHGFGSGIVPEGVGFAMQNRGALFNLDPDHPNRLEPHKRPFHTIIPGFVTKDGRPIFSFGVMGGDQQPQGQVQVLCNMIDFHMDAQQVGNALRFRHDGSSSPTGDVMYDGGTLYLEPGIPESVLDGLRAKGHRVAYREGGYGGYQGIWIDPKTNMLFGGSEPRKDGCASGY
jgi:gamma-glutamyltranspeptidase/glutathione hydrolase